MNIRTKLILMLAIPIVALAVVAFIGFRNQNIDGEANRAAAESIETIATLDRLWLSIADERVAVLGDATNAESQEFIATTELLFEEIEAAGNEAAWAVAAIAQQELPSIRNASLVAPTGEAASLTVLGEYTNALVVIEEGIEEIPLDGLSVDAALTASGLEAGRLATLDAETAWLHFANIETGLDQAVIRELTAEWSAAEVLTERALDTELPGGVRPFADAAQSNALGDLNSLRAVVQNELIGFDESDLEADGSAVPFIQRSLDAVPGVELLDSLEENRANWNASSIEAEEFLLADIAGTQSDLESARSLTLLLAALGAALVFALLFVIGRSIVGPLGRLMENADVMTHERLPAAVAQLRSVGASDEDVTLAPIPKETNDEIGTIVEAFNDMQSSALKVATDQAKSRRNVAEMFVSLGRRNQQLNHRMITMISDLERDEQDPETLRGLYQLDHLATRMRRNAESLLVLAGNRSPRQWSQPVPFDDVVRGSLAEVEYFERIEIGELPDVQMSGAVVTDITHMLAELLDNATQFSDPTTSVHISAVETHTSIEMEISDSGFGIGAGDLAIFNERVTNPPALDEAPSRLLGLFVVGRLAVQHDVYVQLASESGEGTTVSISIPKTHFPVETGENPIDTSPAVGEINSDNASAFFGSSSAGADIETPVLTDIGGENGPGPAPAQDPNALPVRGGAAPVDTAPVDTASADEAPVTHELTGLPVRGGAAAAAAGVGAAAGLPATDDSATSDDEVAEPLEMPIDAAGETESADSWPTAQLDPLPEREASAMEAAQLDAEQDKASEEIEAIDEMEAPTIEPLPTSPIVTDSGDSSFGGLPTRMPQATIETVDTGPSVLPLDIEAPDAAAMGDQESSVSFGHFAKGVEAGLDDVSSDQGEIS